jgi:hypothetical protein
MERQRADDGPACRRHQIHGLRHNSYVHAYVCAKSRADVCRMLADWSGHSGRGLGSYIRDYWSAGHWGDSMNGITPERGLWIQYERAKPVRIRSAEFSI